MRSDLWWQIRSFQNEYIWLYVWRCKTHVQCIRGGGTRQKVLKVQTGRITFLKKRNTNIN